MKKAAQRLVEVLLAYGQHRPLRSQPASGQLKAPFWTSAECNLFSEFASNPIGQQPYVPTMCRLNPFDPCERLLGHSCETASTAIRGHPAGFQKSATGPDLGLYAVRSYSLMRPPRRGRRLIRSWERSATGWSGRGGRRWRLR
jgi:hypothetical protein